MGYPIFIFTLLRYVAFVSLLVLGGGDVAYGEVTRDVFVQLKGPTLSDRLKKAYLPPQAQRQYVAHLKQAQKPLLAKLKQLDIPVIWTFQRVLNGVQVQITRKQQARIERWTEVANVMPLMVLYPTLEDTVPFLGATEAVETFGWTGAGVRVGVIDSGIDYIHKAFGGPGTDAAYAGNDPKSTDDTLGGVPLFPNDVVVGGYDFVGDGYVAGKTPVPDFDPMPERWVEDDAYQFAEHGTHVAGIIGSRGAEGVGVGVAPGALLYALKVFGTGGTVMVPAAIEWAADPDQDGDTSDCLDVLNMSLGNEFSGGSGELVASEALAIQNFTSLGGVVVTSAGNSGDTPFILSAPGAIPHTIAVANTHGPAESTEVLTVVEPKALEGPLSFVEAHKKIAPQLVDTGPVEGPLIHAGFGCSVLDYPEGASGNIALVNRGECTFWEKFSAAEGAGVLALLVANNEEGSLFSMKGSLRSEVPGGLISQADGALLQSQLSEGGPVVVRLAWDTDWKKVDTIRTNSSRGPGWPFEVPIYRQLTAKPDVSAPGTHIVSARAGSGDGGMSKTGTSMAAPHVAGLAAILKERRPEWSSQDIKQAIINTALSPIADAGGQPAFGGKGKPVPFTRQGAGRVDVMAALDNLILATGSPHVTMNLGLQIVEQLTTYEQTLTISNRMEWPVTLTLSFVADPGSASEPGVSVELQETEVTVEAGQTRDVAVNVHIDPGKLPLWSLEDRHPQDEATVDPNRLSEMEMSGRFLMTSSTGKQVQVPFYVLPKSIAHPQLVDEAGCPNPQFDVLKFTSDDGHASYVDAFTLLAEDPEDGTVFNTIDLRAAAVRLMSYEGVQTLEIAIQTVEGRLLADRVDLWVWLDVDGDEVGDYALTHRDQGLVKGDDRVGLSRTLFLAPVNESTAESGNPEITLAWGKYEVLNVGPTLSGTFSNTVVLSVPLDAIERPSETLRFQVLAFTRGDLFSAPAIPLDTIPAANEDDGLVGYISVDLSCALWHLSPQTVAFDDEAMLEVTAVPSCSLAYPEGEVERAGLFFRSNSKDLIASEPLTSAVSLPDLAQVCPSELTLSVEQDRCEVTFNPLTELTPPECVGTLTSEPSSIIVQVGDEKASWLVKDGWGRQVACEPVLTVVDKHLPTLACPTSLAIDEEGGGQIDLEATDNCEVAQLSLDPVSCSGEGCSVTLEGQRVTATGIEAEQTSLSLQFGLSDSSGNEAVISCQVPLVHAPSSGCTVGAETPRHGWVLILLVAGWLGWIRRRHMA